MTQRCRPDARNRVRNARDAARELDVVAAATVLSPADDGTDRWTLEVHVWDRDGRVPHELAGVLARHRLDHRAAPQGNLVHVRALV